MSNKFLKKSKPITNLAIGSALITALSPASFAADIEPEVTNMDVVTVTGKSEQGINAVDNTATKMNLSLKDTGRSVVKVTKEQIEDMSAEDVKDIAEYATSINTSSSADRNVIIRGISTNLDNFMVNGLRSLQGGEAGSGSRSPSTYNVESVTILNGSDAILYGSGVGGGMVNIITKKPQEESETTLGLKTRSYVSGDTANFKRNQVSVSIDSTGELVDDKVLYRVNAELTPDGEEYQEGRSTDEQAIDVSLTFKIGDNTRITPRFEYINRETTGGSSYGDGVYTTNLANGTLGNTTDSFGSILNRSFYYGSPLDKGANKSTTFELSAEHQLQNWTLNATAAAVNTKSSAQDLYASSSSGLGNAIGDSTLERKWVYAQGEDQYFLLDTNTEGKFETGIFKHHLLTGVNIRNKKVKFMRNFQDNEDAIGNNTINVYNPDDQIYTQMPDSLKDGNYSTTTDNEINLYLKDRISLGDFTLALGLGYTRFEGEETSSDDSDYDQSTSNFIYDAGVVYKLTPDVNLFASYSQAYEPIDTSTLVQYGQDGVSYDPEESDNYELGFKGDFFDDKLSTSVTLFYINTKNQTEYETIDGDRALVQRSGEAFRSTGVEVNALLHITDQISSRISYAYTDASDTSGDDKGVQADYTPYNSLSIWNSYKMDSEPVRFALGMRAESGSNDGDYKVPGYAEFDFGTYYELENWDISLVVRNMFDKSRVASTPNWVLAEGNDPRSLNLNFKYRL
ncbi:TonB-dependent receptor [Psychromonas sp. SP041]|uniref:TonB-dependent siderophore receptor n=1 Tax=Psychromonas sp. SP041 TaxID=1365007 RepID=UPI0003FF9BDD|nr:TonB-dependent receptor [Psychromonas sp. SP041]